MEEAEEGGSESRRRGSLSVLRTRSQVAPDWTVHESLILVNELCAVEGDCLNTLSSFQKWKIVVDNCNALDVNRGLNQCRRHWDSLLSDYNKIKQWSNSNSNSKKKKMNGCGSSSSSSSSSYWSLDVGRRRQLGLPEDFDADLFKAIDDHDKARGGRCDTDPETDLDDAEADLLINLIAESGSKKPKRKGIIKPPKQSSSKDREKHERGGIKSEKKIKAERCSSSSEEKVDFRCHLTQRVVAAVADEMAEETTTTTTTTTTNNDNKKLSREDKEQVLSQKLRGNAEMINATLKGEDIDYKLADLRNLEAIQVDIVRRQADDLVIYLTNIAHTLDQLCKLVQEGA